MTNTAALIRKFWSGEASMVELELLHEMLADENCSLRQELLEAYEHSLHTGNISYNLNKQREAEILIALNGKMKVEKPKESKLIFFRKTIVWAAASILLIVAGTYFGAKLITNKNEDIREVLVNKTEDTNPSTIANYSDTVLPVVLTDSSLIALSPGSYLVISPDFNRNKRDIELVGKANFKVAKDINRPFTVLAKGFKTTALGTQFLINTLLKDTIDVKLLEGKVVIKQADWKIGDDQVYLLPNQEFICSIATGATTVTEFSNSQMPGDKKKTSVMSKEILTELNFENEPLEIVFKRLQTAFSTRIHFDKKEVATMQLTGTFLKKDGLQKVLAVICNMNDLVFRERSGAIIISKKN